MRILNCFKGTSTPISSIILLLILIFGGMFHYAFYSTEMDYQEMHLQAIENNRKDLIWQAIETTIVSTNETAEMSARLEAEVLVSEVNQNINLSEMKESLKEIDITDSNLVSLLYKNM